MSIPPFKVLIQGTYDDPIKRTRMIWKDEEKYIGIKMNEEIWVPTDKIYIGDAERYTPILDIASYRGKECLIYMTELIQRPQSHSDIVLGIHSYAVSAVVIKQ